MPTTVLLCYRVQECVRVSHCVCMFDVRGGVVMG